ncbi:MAG: hypothetical protein KGZ57_04395 [Dethiobacter sp.]|nr:hypothetical protein [Dethiobacter sp.]MCL5981975.1 hypothetical protein [Bacillota bacterium]
MVRLGNPKKLLMVALLLAATLVAGCMPGPSGQPGTMTGREEAGRAVEGKPGAEEKEAATEQASAPEQQDTVPAQELQDRPDKQLVIISENPVFADSGQLLGALDKELETLLSVLGAMDDIQDEELNF